MILRMRVIAGMGLFAISMLPTSCQTAPAKQRLKEDRLEVESKRLAGPGAIDCGRVTTKGDPKDATQCAIAAQKAEKPFRVRYDIQGIDSAVAVALVRTPVGTVGVLTYDSDPSGGSHVGAVVYPKRCPEPVHLWLTPSGRVNCFPPEASARKDVMAPNAEPY